MLTCDIKPSLKVVSLIAQIERFAGFWEHISDSLRDSEEQRLIETIRGAENAILIDPTSLPNVRTNLSSALVADVVSLLPDSPPQLSALVAAHNDDAFSLSIEHLSDLHRLICSSDLKVHRMLDKSGVFKEINYRNSSLLFTTESKEPIFSTVPSFLIPAKMRELLEWTNKELDAGDIHPLLVISVFYLLLLQIHPFSEATPRLAIVVSWHLLAENGFSFVTASHFSPHLLRRSRGYVQALRQAEKTVNANWSTLNSWLEFFLETLLESANLLEKTIQQSNLQARLTTVQKQIIEIVKTNGAATRERISKESGINLSTVKYNLSVLSRRGHLRRQGGGRTTNYSLI